MVAWHLEALYGVLTNMFGIPFTLSLASLALGATIFARMYYNTTIVSDMDFTPASSDHWSLPPHLLVESAQSDDQTLITIEYRIDPKLSGEFERGHVN